MELFRPGRNIAASLTNKHRKIILISNGWERAISKNIEWKAVILSTSQREMTSDHKFTPLLSTATL
jgi:hypothetical protein